jgi:hypothetical protein
MKMALTGIQIFKLLPKTNCKECGVPTCLAFAMNLAAGKAELSDCPYVSDDAKAKLVLERGIGYQRLVGPHSVQVPEMALVKPGDPDGSYLWMKLQHLTEEGDGMPRTLTGSKKLRTAELELYRRWIEDGAKP